MYLLLLLFFFFHKNLFPVFFNLENQIEMKVLAKKAKVPDQTRGHNIYETLTSN